MRLMGKFSHHKSNFILFYGCKINNSSLSVHPHHIFSFISPLNEPQQSHDTLTKAEKLFHTRVWWGKNVNGACNCCCKSFFHVVTLSLILPLLHNDIESVDMECEGVLYEVTTRKWIRRHRVDGVTMRIYNDFSMLL